MGLNVGISLGQMRDGASNTVLLAEIRAGVTSYDSRGVWALGGACSSALWAHGGIYGDDYGPNCPFVISDNLLNCTQIQDAFGGGYGPLAAEGMPCTARTWQGNDEQTARSMHPGGVNTCFADGSIHWISDYIQAAPSSPGAFRFGTG